ncbi:hypothetical protein C8R44DRAFT_741006 [Mycena epipterygia]|nr:hypothetical protein C8R44DRAFT_741006 [Mycena epipterygia]
MVQDRRRGRRQALWKVHTAKEGPQAAEGGRLGVDCGRGLGADAGDAGERRMAGRLGRLAQTKRGNVRDKQAAQGGRAGGAGHGWKKSGAEAARKLFRAWARVEHPTADCTAIQNGCCAAVVSDVVHNGRSNQPKLSRMAESEVVAAFSLKWDAVTMASYNSGNRSSSDRTTISFQNTEEPGTVDQESGESHNSLHLRLGSPELIAMMEQLITQASPKNENLPGYYMALGESFRTRYENSGNLDDLESLVQKLQAALDLTTEEWPNRAHLQAALAWGLTEKFQQWGKMEDLDASLQLKQRVLEQTPEDHPKRAHWLQELEWGTLKTFRLQLGQNRKQWI